MKLNTKAVGIALTSLLFLGLLVPFSPAKGPETVKMDKNVYFAYRSFWPEHETMKKFQNCGVNTICLFPSSTTNSLGEPYGKYPSVWRYPNAYDWKSLDRQFDEIIAFNPKAEFLCMVDLNTPIWLARMLGMHGDGNFDSFIDLSNCLASVAWKKHTMQYLTDFITHTEKKYGKRIRAYILACGQTDEWMDYSAGRSSRAKQSAWQKWSKEKGFPIPENLISYQRLDSATLENFIRDPQKEADILRYVAFHQDLTADTIIEFAKKAKELTASQKEVGVFFGYIMELTGWRMVECGHLGYEKVYSSPYLDFFISPGSYSDRPMGGGSGFMVANATRLLNNKGFMHETDHRTTTYNCNLNEFVSIGWMNNWKSQQEDIAGMRRELALALVNHASIWFFDMWGQAHKTDAAIENVRLMKQVWDRFESDRSSTAAEVLMVVDPQGLMQINDRHGFSPLMHNGLRNKLNRLGAPFEICSFNDLSKLNLDQYKFLIFPSSFLITPERQKVLDKYVLKNNRTILWCYAPGVSDGKSLDIQRVEKLTGTPFKTAGVQKVKRDNYNSVYIYDYKMFTPGLLKSLAKSAGVNIWCDEEVPVYANGKLCAVHTAIGGKKTIRLPQKYSEVKEVFSGKVAARNASEFTWEFATPETALFELK